HVTDLSYPWSSISKSTTPMSRGVNAGYVKLYRPSLSVPIFNAKTFDPREFIAIPRRQVERVRGQRDALRNELHERLEQIDSLTRELDETNRGVVALYAELDDRALELRQVVELKSRFLSYMSHEFRTPLGSIRSMTRILLDGMDGPLTNEQERQI